MSKNTLLKANYIKHTNDIFNIPLKNINTDVLDVSKKLKFVGLNDDENGIFLEFLSASHLSASLREVREVHSYDEEPPVERLEEPRTKYKIYFELDEVDTSSRKNKKLYAKFRFFGPIQDRDDVNILTEPYYKTIHFGHNQYQDYTIHKDENRKNLYHKRAVVHHQDPLNAGTLSLYILWSYPSIERGIQYYKTSYKL